MKRIINIPEELYKKIMVHRALTKYQEHIDYEDLKNMVEDSTPLNDDYISTKELQEFVDSLPIKDEYLSYAISRLIEAIPSLANKIDSHLIKPCDNCQNNNSHHGVCDICHEFSCWTPIGGWKKNLNVLPSVYPKNETLEQEPTTKNDLGVDLISRADVLKLMKDNWHTHNGDWAMQESLDDIRALPLVIPIRPKGHWIIKGEDWICSYCNDSVCEIYDGKPWEHFCPNCGADMSEVDNGNNNKTFQAVECVEKI